MVHLELCSNAKMHVVASEKMRASRDSHQSDLLRVEDGEEREGIS